MKTKIFSVIAVVLFMSSSLNANSNVKQVAYYGKASDCVKYARNIILKAADEYNLDISRDGQHFELMMAFYMDIYQDCLFN